MFFFRRELETLAAEVRDGRSVNVLASPGMGLSTLLDELIRVLEAEGFSALRLDGRSYARTAEGFPLQQAGLSPHDARGPRGIGGWIDLVSGELRSPRAGFLVLDGIDVMDATTLSVAQAAAQRTKLPVVVGRGTSLLAMRASGTEYSLPLGVSVTLSPLDYASVARLVQQRLGHFPQAEVVSRIYSGSGGITGLAIAYIDGARAEGLIHLHDDRWSMRAPRLWSSTVEGWIESLLARLSLGEVDALRHLAIAHEESAEECTRVDPSVLRELGHRGLLRVARQHPYGRSYTVSPPALTTYFAGTPTSLGDRAEESATAGVLVNNSRTGLAHAVRTHRERVQHEISERQASWEKDPRVKHAIPYVLSLQRTTPKADRTIETVLSATSLATAQNPTEAFDWEFIRATWQADGLREGVASFREFVDLFPEWGATTELFFAILEGRADLRDAQLDEHSPDFIGSMPGGDLLIAAYSYAALIAGRFDEAQRWAGRIPSRGTLTVQRLGGFVVALAKFSVGDVPGAIVDTRERIAVAVAEADHSGVLMHTYVQTLSLLGAGQWDDALSAIDEALAFGPPSAMDAGFYLALLHAASFLNLQRGDRRTCEIFLAEAEAVYAPPAPLPGMQSAMGEGVRHLLEGRPLDAGEVLRELADELWSSGAVFAAVLTLRIALFFWPEEATLNEYERMCAATSDGVSPAFVEIVSTALRSPQDVPEIVRQHLGERHADMSAIVLAARLRQLTVADVSATTAIREAIAMLEATGTAIAPRAAVPALGSIGRDGGALLSRREREIALLARNNTNADIASRLNLSVRTVESHLHNAFRKTHVTSRAELFEVARS